MSFIDVILRQLDEHPDRAFVIEVHGERLEATRGGRLRVCQQLVRLGADVLSSDRDGRNALHYSARRGHVDVARWFIAQGLSVARTDVHALTPLHQATLGKNAAMVDFFEAEQDRAHTDPNFPIRPGVEITGAFLACLLEVLRPLLEQAKREEERSTAADLVPSALP